MILQDYEEPDVEEIAAEILRGLVDDDQIGVRLIDVNDEFLREYELNQGELPSEEDLDYIMLRRMGGYVDEDTFTDISGLDLTVFTKQRSRGKRLMQQATRRLLAAQDETFNGFNIDIVRVLNGPNPDQLLIVDDSVIDKTFEFQIRVKWL